AVLSAPRGRWARGEGHRARARRDAAPGAARVAAGTLAGDAADPGHAVARAPEGEHGRARARADESRGRGAVVVGAAGEGSEMRKAGRISATGLPGCRCRARSRSPR